MALVVKSLPANAGHVRDVGSISESERSARGGHGNTLQYSCLENLMDGGAWRATVHRVARSWTLLKGLSTHIQFLGGSFYPPRRPQVARISSLFMVTSWTMFCLMSESPSGKREGFQGNATCKKKGKFITDSSQGSCHASNTVVRDQRALSGGGYPNL